MIKIKKGKMKIRIDFRGKIAEAKIAKAFGYFNEFWIIHRPFCYDSFNKIGWNVSHYRTGFRLPLREYDIKTINKAIECGKEKLKKVGKEKVFDCIKEAIKNYGILNDEIGG